MSINRLRLTRLFPIAGVVTLGAFTGCASSTVLQTQPPGARVTINGMVVGQTPYTLTDTKIVSSQTPIRFEYPGYAPIDVMLVRNEELDPLPLIAGLFTLIPLLWVMRYQPAHLYTFQAPGAYPQNAWAPPPAQQGYPQQQPPQGYPPGGPAGYPPPPPGYPPAAQ
jgi:PEGA domain